ncbi:MAG: hypothetical protein AAB380_08165 [Verrucomicrobiota bacterium]
MSRNRGGNRPTLTIVSNLNCLTPREEELFGLGGKGQLVGR